MKEKFFKNKSFLYGAKTKTPPALPSGQEGRRR